MLIGREFCTILIYLVIKAALLVYFDYTSKQFLTQKNIVKLVNGLNNGPTVLNNTKSIF